MPTTQLNPGIDEITLHRGDLVAAVTPIGAGLRALTTAGRPLIAGYRADQEPVGFQGVVLAPWANRIGDGRYPFAGQVHQLPLNEADRGNALHGLVFDVPWSVRERTGRAVRLAHRLPPRDGYPFTLDLTVDYLLSAAGLSFRLTATNIGERPAPYGGSFHPYLVAGSGTVDEWTLRSPAARYLEVDPHRLLPGRIGSDPAMDFRTPTALRGVEVDHAFTDIDFGPDGRAELTLTDRDGIGSRMRWDTAAPWLQLCIPGDRFPRLTRRALAVEPMTGPPDAFRSGIDLVVLNPGDRHTLWLEIGAIG